MDPRPLKGVCTVGQDGAPAAGGEQFRAAEAQHADRTPGARRPALHRRAGRLGRVLDNRNAVRIRQRENIPHRRQATVQVRHDHRLGRRGQRLRKPRGVHVPVVRINVDQHRHGPDRENAEVIAGIVVGAQNDLGAGTDQEGP